VSFRFIPGRKSIPVRVEIDGPSSSAIVRLSLDTGTSRTVINPSILSSVGVDLTAPLRQVQMTTVSGTTSTPLVRVPALRALGQTRFNVEVVSHQLPSSTTTDGLLGLDFFQDLELTIDFRNGEIRLT
jgi:predicted aspartyl protease